MAQTAVRDSPPYLGKLAAVAGRRFATTDEAVAAILALIVAQLGLRTSFLARADPAAGSFAVLASHNAPGGCAIVVGDAAPLADHY